jgi:4-hydroxy-tetrahydrodipicolinate synthase
MDYTRSEAKTWSQKNLRGFYDAPLTPYTIDGNLDEEGIRKNVEAFIDMGMSGLSIGGFIAEAWNLKLSDWFRYHEIYADAAKGRIDLSTIILDPSVHQALEKLDFCEKLGFNSAEIMNPSVQLKTDDEIFNFYKYISDHSDMAVVLYRTPVSGTVLSMEVMHRLADLETLVGVKQGSLKRSDTLKLRRDIRSDFFISEGAEYCFYEDLLLGYPIIGWAAFFFTVYGKKRQIILDYIKLGEEGKMDECKELWLSLRPVWNFVEELTVWSIARTQTYASAFAILKPWYDAMGLNGGHTLAPVEYPSPDRVEWLKANLKDLGVI